MRRVAAPFITLMLFSVLALLGSATPGQALTPAPPQESLGGLVPGDALTSVEHVFGHYDIVLPGEAMGYVGGNDVTKAFRWSAGATYGGPGLTVEAPIGGKSIAIIMVDNYPGLQTQRGLTALAPETEAIRLYGLPDYADELRFGDARYRELFYLEEGLLVVLSQVPGRPNWTITKLLLTYPTYLMNGVSLRFRLAQRYANIEDITHSYRVWARMAIPPE